MLKSKWGRILESKKWNNKEEIKKEFKEKIDRINILMQKENSEELQQQLIDLSVVCIAAVREKYKDKDKNEIEKILNNLEKDSYKWFVKNL